MKLVVLLRALSTVILHTAKKLFAWLCTANYLFEITVY